MDRFVRFSRVIGAAVVIALILVGSITGDAGAAKKGSPGASQANDMINACFAQGGDASVAQMNGETTVLCTFPDGRWEACTWSTAGMHCNRGVHSSIKVSDLIIVNGLPTIQLQPAATPTSRSTTSRLNSNSAISNDES